MELDRSDLRSAQLLFKTLWPNAVVSTAVATNLAASIRAAHAAGNASWEVTMFPNGNGIRLNVGQVETLTIGAAEARFLFQSPPDASFNERFEMEILDGPYYRSVPVPSGVCVVPVAELESVPTPLRVAHEAYIQAAVSVKQVSPFKRFFSTAILDYIDLTLGSRLPRPSYLTAVSIGPMFDPLADELDISRPIFEGAKSWIVVNAYERNPHAKEICKMKHGTSCIICGFSFAAVYGPMMEGFIHVHHLRPLSKIDGEYEVNPIEDLRPVCPNCHAVLHSRRDGVFSIEDVREMLERAKGD